MDTMSLERKKPFKDEKGPKLELLRNYILSHEKCHQKGIKIGSPSSIASFFPGYFYEKMKSSHQKPLDPQTKHI